MDEANAVLWQQAVFATLAASWLGRQVYLRNGRLVEGLIAAFCFLASGLFFSYLSWRRKR